MKKLLKKILWCCVLAIVNYVIANFFLLLISGWLYCSAITCCRPDPTLNRRGERIDFYKLMVCVVAIGALFPPENVDLVFVLGFFLGANFTYVDKVLFFRKIGDKLVVPSRWSTFTAVEYAVLALITLCGILVGAWALFEVLSAPFSRILAAAGAYAAGFFAFAMAYLRLRSTHELHAHHNLLGLLGVPLLGFVQAALLGIFIEGSCRWGLKKPFDSRKDPQKLKWVHGMNEKTS